MIYVYGDDGADEKQQRVLSVAVIAGYEDWWEELESKWIDKCRGIPFHAKDCESDWQDFSPKTADITVADAKHKENKKLYRDLATLLVESKVGGIAVAFDLVAQHKVFPFSLELAYYRAFLECMTGAANVAKSVGEIAKLTFDISTENAFNAAYLYKTMRDNDPELLEWLHPELSFVPWKNSARVQAADLLAYESWKALDHTVGPIQRKRGSWEALRNTGRFETYSYSEEWFIDLSRNLGNLEKKVGFNEQDYRQWLKDRNRHHNMSNMFEFLDWTAKRDKAKDGI